MTEIVPRRLRAFLACSPQLSHALVTTLSRLSTAALIVTVVGLLPWLSGGDPALSLLRARSSEQEATPEVLQAIRQQLGLEHGPLALLRTWLNGLLHGDAGTSWVSGKSVLPGMLEAASVSLTLMGCALLIALALAALLCVSTVAGGLRGRVRHSNGAWATALTALPEFLLASVFLIVGAVWLRWFPPYGWQHWQHAVLPALALGLPAGGLLGRLLADALQAAFGEPWLITWSAAGVGPAQRLLALLRRTLPALMPQIGLVIVGLTGGAIAVEKVFAIPGLGRATLGAAAAQDLPALQCGILILLSIATVAGAGANLIRFLLLGRAIRSGSLSVPPPAAPHRRRAWWFPVAIAALLLAMIVIGLPRDPLASTLVRLQPPELALPFGADATGRDVLARVAHGALSTMVTAAGVTFACLIIGIGVGLFPRVLSGPIEVANAMPPIMSGLIVVAITGPSAYGAALAVALVSWSPLAAHSAALVEEIMARPYVRIAPLLGVGRWHRLTEYVLPALIGPVTRHALLRLPGITLALTALGFLGLGQQPPLPEWGRVLAEGMPYVERAAWGVAAPVAALILLSVLAVSLGQLAAPVGERRRSSDNVT